ncbi:MAG: hypothetical protein UV49_C0026G0004 [candidate division WWE3 bacterium GW2011_GWA2_42_9]|nr:MAG: hypothetical protein UV49_C0026G0004 [candidate division WWE3 bacterium GW2011_GWA2_42_9]
MKTIVVIVLFVIAAFSVFSVPAAATPASGDSGLPREGWHVDSYLGYGSVPGQSGSFHRFELKANNFAVRAYCVEPLKENPPIGIQPTHRQKPRHQHQRVHQPKLRHQHLLRCQQQHRRELLPLRKYLQQRCRLRKSRPPTHRYRRTHQQLVRPNQPEQLQLYLQVGMVCLSLLHSPKATVSKYRGALV